MPGRDNFDVRITVYDDRIIALNRSPETHDFLRSIVDEEARALADAAPVRTGAGRSSIRGRVEMGSDGWIGAASWDTSHYYMGLRNTRTHWADRVAAQQVRYV
jgi:hypothetical protein